MSTPSGILFGEYRTVGEAEAAHNQYVLDQRNADALEIVFDDDRDDAPIDRELPRGS